MYQLLRRFLSVIRRRAIPARKHKPASCLFEALESRALMSAPDLSVSDLNAISEVRPGQQFLVTFGVVNSGDDEMPPWEDRLYLSADSQLSSDDLLVGVYGRTSSNNESDSRRLQPGIGATFSKTFTMPAGPSGDYFLIFQTDGADAATESNEANNTYSRPIRRLLQPDLAITNAMAPAEIVVGLPFAMSHTVANLSPYLFDLFEAGGALAFLSTDTQYDAGDLFVGNFPSHPPRSPVLSAGDRVTMNSLGEISRTGSTPPSLGDQYLLVLIDRDERIVESNEVNNVFAVPVRIAAVELAVTGFSAPPTAVAGQWIDVTYTVTNIGDAALPSDRYWTDLFYLDAQTPGPSYDNAGEFVGWVQVGGPRPRPADYEGLAPQFQARTSPLYPGQSLTVTTLFKVPGGATGNLNLVLDGADRRFAGDLNGTNNIASLPITITSPDLAVDPLQVVIAANGRKADVTYTVRNTGDAAVSGRWRDKLFFGPESADDPSDLFALKEVKFRSQSLQPGQSYSKTVRVSLPAARKLQAGDYRFGLFSDSRFEVTELEETLNNVGLSEIFPVTPRKARNR